MLKVGIVGTGSIGSSVAMELHGGAVSDAGVTSVFNRTLERAHALVKALEAESEIEVAPGPLAVCDRADVVLETAGQGIIEQSARDIVETGTDLVVLSVGAFRDRELLRDVRTECEESGARVLIPSAAIAGLDGVAAVSNESEWEVSLVHNRRPEYLEPFINEGTNPDDLADGDVVYEGTAAEAAESFPSHMNIAMALTLAAKMDPTDVSVRIVVDIDAPRSRNVVRARSNRGAVETEIQNFVSPTHETSALIVSSVIETLERVADRVIVGT